MNAFGHNGGNRATAHLVRGLVLAPLFLLLAACTIGQTSAPRSLPTDTPTPPPLYTADWSQGLTGWQATPGWTITNGALESSGADGLALTIPYQPPAGNYTVEIDLQLVSVTKIGGFYELVVPPSANANGYFAGVENLRPGPRQYADHPTIITQLDPASEQNTSRGGNLPVADFEPGDGVGVYQFEVLGPSLVLYENGHFFVEADGATSKPLATGPLQIKVSGAQVRITAIKIFA